MSERLKTGTRPRGQSARASYIDIFRATPVARIAMIKSGVLAVEAKRILADLAGTQGEAFAALNLSAATVNRKAALNKTLSTDESERVIGMAMLIGRLEAVMADAGVTEAFDAAGWLSRWLRDPLPAFGGTRPVDLLDTMEGQAMVANALAQTQSGAYA